jgi:hypothetical protein
MIDRGATPVHSGREFHLIDLLPDCCCADRVDLEIKLRRVEESLDTWPYGKICELESNDYQAPGVTARL